MQESHKWRTQTTLGSLMVTSFDLMLHYMVYISSLLSATYFKTFSFYFTFLGEPCSTAPNSLVDNWGGRCSDPKASMLDYGLSSPLLARVIILCS